MIETPNEWKGLPRSELAAQWRPATECHDGKYEVSSTHSEGEVMRNAVTAQGLMESERLLEELFGTGPG